MELKKEINMDQFRRALPVGIRKTLTEDLYETINSISGDNVFREHYKDTLFCYSSVLKDGRYKLNEYITAVKYVSSKLLGNSDVKSYMVAHPERYQRMLDMGYQQNRVSGHVSAYNKTGLVMEILGQAMVPTYLLNADLFQKALNAQAMLMISAKSEKVRSDAANSLLTHLKVPEAQKIQLEIGVSEDGAIQELRNTVAALVTQEKRMLERGEMGVKDIAERGLVYDADFKKEEEKEGEEVEIAGSK